MAKQPLHTHKSLDWEGRDQSLFQHLYFAHKQDVEVSKIISAPPERLVMVHRTAHRGEVVIERTALKDAQLSDLAKLHAALFFSLVRFATAIRDGKGADTPGDVVDVVRLLTEEALGLVMRDNGDAVLTTLSSI